MSWIDQVNGLVFEACGALLAWSNVRRIRKDRTVQGVDWRISCFWAVWGWWNVFYYHAVGHAISLVAGAVLAAANTCWCAHAWWYIHGRAFVLEVRYRRELRAWEDDMDSGCGAGPKPRMPSPDRARCATCSKLAPCRQHGVRS
jgi:hypothetical protein